MKRGISNMHRAGIAWAVTWPRWTLSSCNSIWPLSSFAENVTCRPLLLQNLYIGFNKYARGSCHTIKIPCRCQTPHSSQCSYSCKYWVVESLYRYRLHKWRVVEREKGVTPFPCIITWWRDWITSKQRQETCSTVKDVVKPDDCQIYDILAREKCAFSSYLPVVEFIFIPLPWADDIEFT